MPKLVYTLLIALAAVSIMYAAPARAGSCDGKPTPCVEQPVPFVNGARVTIRFSSGNMYDRSYTGMRGGLHVFSDTRVATGEWVMDTFTDNAFNIVRWNGRTKSERFAPNDGMVRFPLYTGASWVAPYHVDNGVSRGTTWVRHATVVGTERLRGSDGSSLDTFKVKSTFEGSDRDDWHVQYVWYAPKLGVIVQIAHVVEGSLRMRYAFEGYHLPIPGVALNN